MATATRTDSPQRSTAPAPVPLEGTLCLGLVSTGLPAVLVLAAVLLYRLVSFWLVMVAGWLVLLYLRLERPARAVSIKGSVAL
jgi:hypothetical protein